jgi:hypothetical protein
VNRETLKRLNRILFLRWVETTDEFGTLADNGRHIIKAHVKWHQICESLGIERLKRMGEDEFDPDGQMLEESIVLMDPAFYGTWLQIPNETAEKILVIGMP